jgi:hypothetical protein
MVESALRCRKGDLNFEWATFGLKVGDHKAIAATGGVGASYWIADKPTAADRAEVF